MNATQVYKFCPRDAAPLEITGSNMLTCTQCKNHIFINASATAAIIIENERGDILMTKKAFNPGKGQWDLPGGFVMPNESVEEAAVREAQEELGVEIEPGKIQFTSSNNYLYQDIDVPLLDVFISAKIISGEPSPSDDAAELRYISIEDIPNADIWAQKIRNGILRYINERKSSNTDR